MQTSDGRNFAHKGMASSWENHIKANPAAAMKKPGMEDKDGAHDDEQVVSEHGPAHTTHIQKDKAKGTYSVHSHHEDGHKHSSHGHDLAGAHEHSKMMHGGEEEGHQPDTMGGDQGDDEEAEMSHMG